MSFSGSLCLLICNRDLHIYRNFEAHELSYEQWKSVLHLSTRWGFASLRKLALKSIRPPTSHDQLVLARTYSVEEWVLPALTALCSRSLPLSLDEARQMDIEDVILVAAVREEIRGGALRVNAADIPQYVEMAQGNRLVSKVYSDKLESGSTGQESGSTMDPVSKSVNASTTGEALQAEKLGDPPEDTHTGEHLIVTTEVPVAAHIATAGPITCRPTVPQLATRRPTMPRPTNAGPTTPGPRPTTLWPTTAGPTTPGPTTPQPTTAGLTMPGSTMPGPTTPWPITAGPTTAGPTTSGPTTPGPIMPGPTTPWPTTARPTTSGPTTPGPIMPGLTTPWPTTAGPTIPGPTTPRTTIPRDEGGCNEGEGREGGEKVLEDDRIVPTIVTKDSMSVGAPDAPTPNGDCGIPVKTKKGGVIARTPVAPCAGCIAGDCNCTAMKKKKKKKK